MIQHPMEKRQKSVITQLMANEQTFLSWLRTGVEVMAFGFVAIRFSLFASQVMGILLVGVGALVQISAYFRYRAMVKQLRNGDFRYNMQLLTAVAIAIFIISAILFAYLIAAQIGTTGKP